MVPRINTDRGHSCHILIHSLHYDRRDRVGLKSDHVTSPLTTCQWLSSVLRIKVKLLGKSSEAFMIWPLPTSQTLLLCIHLLTPPTHLPDKNQCTEEQTSSTKLPVLPTPLPISADSHCPHTRSLHLVVGPRFWSLTGLHFL